MKIDDKMALYKAPQSKKMLVLILFIMGFLIILINFSSASVSIFNLSFSGNVGTESASEIAGLNAIPLHDSTTLVNTTKDSSCTSTKAYFYLGTGADTGTLLDTATFSGDTAIFDSNATMNTGNHYFVTAGKDGSSYTRTYAQSGVTYPQNDSNINVTGFLIYGGGGLQTNNYRNIIKIATSIVSSSINLTLNSPVEVLNSSVNYQQFNSSIVSLSAIINTSIFTNMTGSWATNQTNTSGFNNTIYLFNITGISDAVIKWGFQSCDATICNFSANRTLIVDSHVPIITLNSPANAYNSSISYESFNATISDNIIISNVSLYFNGTLNQTNTSGFNNTLYNFNITGISEGIHSWIIGSCDQSDNCINSSSRTTNFDFHNPVSNSNSPADNYITTLGSITFNGTAFDNIAIQNVSLYLNGTLNQTNSSGFNNTIYLFTTLLTNGYYSWFIQACDWISLCTNSTSRFFTIDSIAPFINFVLPTLLNNSNSSLNYIQTNVTANDSLSGLQNITINLYDSSGSLINFSTANNSASFSNAFCYQALANQSTAGDGACSNYTNGNYSVSGNWTNQANLYDINYNTFAFNSHGLGGWCYQESANISNQSSKGTGGNPAGDGGCQLNYSGNYSIAGAAWVNGGTTTFDGNWSSSDILSGIDNDAFVYVNYSIPIGELSTSLWQVKDDNNIVNLSISSCDANNSMLKLRIDSDNQVPPVVAHQTWWQCQLSSGVWSTLRSGGGGTAYEEAMWWNISGQTNILQENWTKPNNSQQSSSFWQVKDDLGLKNLTISSDCWNYNSTSLKLKVDASNGVNWQCYNGSVWNSLASETANTNVYENSMYWNIQTTQAQLSPFSTIFSALPFGTYYINSTAYDFANNSNSTETRTITLEPLPVLSINQPFGTYNYLNNITFNVSAGFYNSSINLSVCNYWVLRGASYEIAQTPISLNQTNTTTGTFNVSSDLTNYIFELLCNDTAGNVNLWASNFNINAQQQNANNGAGGGGGGYYVPLNETNQTQTLIPGTCQQFSTIFDNLLISHPNFKFLDILVNFWRQILDVTLCKAAASVYPID